jgi:hypothetical protein
MIKIKKLPAGKAEGADDLANWAHRRLAGRSGMRLTRKERKVAAARTDAEDATAHRLTRDDPRYRGSA